jgi:hypothetical protein
MIKVKSEVAKFKRILKWQGLFLTLAFLLLNIRFPVKIKPPSVPVTEGGIV